MIPLGHGPESLTLADEAYILGDPINSAKMLRLNCLMLRGVSDWGIIEDATIFFRGSLPGMNSDLTEDERRILRTWVETDQKAMAEDIHYAEREFLDKHASTSQMFGILARSLPLKSLERIILKRQPYKNITDVVSPYF